MPVKRITLRLTFETPFNVGSGAMGGSPADKPLTRDARGLPMIPGSAFKGRLRHEVERLAHLFFPNDRPPCGAPRAADMCQTDPCIVCRLFGSPWHPARLICSDFTLVEPRLPAAKWPPGHLRYGVGLSRHRRVAEDQLLYTTETFMPGAPLTLQGTLRGELDDQELELLQAALGNLSAIGGGKTRGLGWFDLQVQVQDEPEETGEFRLGWNAEWLDVTVRIESATLLGTDTSEAFYNPTRTYIPGSVLRGSLARLLLSSCPHGPSEPHIGCDLGLLFQSAQVPIFEHLYPAVGLPALVFPAPLTARSCKTHPGFQGTKLSEDQGHGVGDILVRQTVFEAMLEDGVLLPALYRPCCPILECGDEVERFEEFLMMFPTPQGAAFDKVSVPVRRTSRTAIDRRRGVAADEQLYTLEMIEPQDGHGQPTEFQGRVRAAPEQLRPLAQWLTRLEAIGRKQSSGLGRIQVTVREGRPDHDPLPSLYKRLQGLNQAIREEWGYYERVARVAKVAPLPPDTHFVSLDLLSPAVLTWHGVPVTCPPLEMLGLPGQVRLQRAFAAYGIRGGWHLGAGLPRRTQQVVSMGSVFLYRCDGCTLEDLLEPLERLEEMGLGSDRARGMGRIMVCLPFHYQAEVQL